MTLAMAAEDPVSAVKNTYYRVEFVLESSFIKQMTVGTYDIVVSLGPAYENLSELTGSGGMSVATVRMKLDK